MGIAQNVPTTYYYYDDWMVSWVTAVADSSEPDDVYSISYGSYELGFTSLEIQTFEKEAIKLAMIGTTLLASSGDDGVAGSAAVCKSSSCGYYPMFPASSPYVTAVGATEGK